MEPFRRVAGVAAPLDRPNVDTDQIIPKQFLKRIERTGYGPFLFYDWRYFTDRRGDVDGGAASTDVPSAAALPEDNSDFELNQPPWRHAPVLLTGRNFGCGSSREHAAWALQDYGVRAIIAPSFGDIFYNNALKVGLLPVRVREEVTTAWIEAAQEQPGLEAVVDLETGFIEFCGQRQPIEIDADARERLLGGLDEIALTEQHVDAITAFESQRPVWLPRTDAVTAR